MGGRFQMTHPGRIGDDAPIVIVARPSPEPMIPINPEFFYPKMWFWDLVTMPKRPAPNSYPSLQKIIHVVALQYEVTVEEIHSARRDMKLVTPRQVIMYLCREMTMMTFPQIGRKIGNRDHTTIIHGYKKIKQVMEISPELRAVISELKAVIQR